MIFSTGSHSGVVIVGLGVVAGLAVVGSAEVVVLGGSGHYTPEHKRYFQSYLISGEAQLWEKQVQTLSFSALAVTYFGTSRQGRAPGAAGKARSIRHCTNDCRVGPVWTHSTRQSRR